MRISAISFGNLKRRPGKTVLLVTGLTIGIAMVVALMGITMRMQSDIENKLDEYGANIIITPRSENMSMTYGGVSITSASYDQTELFAQDAEKINTIENNKNISAIAPKLIGKSTSGERSVLVVGVDFPAEFRIKKWWHLEGMPHMERTGFEEPPVKGDGEVLLGHSVAALLNVKSGDELNVGGQSFRVAGVLQENASQDDTAVFMSLPVAQRILNKPGAISMIEVSALCADCPIEDLVAQIGGKLPHARVSPVRQAMTLKMQTVDQVVRFSIAVSIVVLLIGSLIVFVSMLSSVNERTKEIGVLRAIGFRQRHIMRVILLEAFVVSAAAGVLGWIIGTLSTTALSSELLESSGGFSVNPTMLGMAIAISIIIGMGSSIYPAVKASRLDPIEALRYI